MRRFVLLTVLSSVLCLAYFFILDRLFLSSRHFSPIFDLLLTGYDVQVAWLAVAVSCLAALWNRPAPILRSVDFLSDHPVGLVLVIVALTGLGSTFIYHSYPLCMDEYAALFQSKVFASGHVAAQLPPAMVNWLVNPAYNGAFLIASPETGRAIESYLPGFSLLLAPFEFLNAPWLCNALLGGGAVYLMYRITFEITGDRRAAGWTIIFAIASGAFFANAISYYSMQAHLTLNLLFAWLLLRPTRYRALAAGLVGSFALVLHNPLPHTLFALPWIVAMAANKDLRRHLAPLVAGYLPITLTLGLGWVILSQIHRANGSRDSGGAHLGQRCFQDSRCQYYEHSHCRSREDVGLGATRPFRIGGMGQKSPQRQSARTPSGAIRSTYVSRISLRGSRSGPWLGLSLFSFSLGNRSHTRRLCDDRQVRSRSTTHILRGRGVYSQCSGHCALSDASNGALHVAALEPIAPAHPAGEQCIFHQPSRWVLHC